MKNKIIKALNARAVNPIVQEVYDILVGLYSKNKCVMQILGDLVMWSSRRRGDWKPDFLMFLNHVAKKMSDASGPALFEDTLRATLMAAGHKWFEDYAWECFRGPTVAADNKDKNAMKNTNKLFLNAITKAAENEK